VPVSIQQSTTSGKSRQGRYDGPFDAEERRETETAASMAADDILAGRLRGSEPSWAGGGMRSRTSNVAYHRVLPEGEDGSSDNTSRPSHAEASATFRTVPSTGIGLVTVPLSSSTSASTTFDSTASRVAEVRAPAADGCACHGTVHSDASRRAMSKRSVFKRASMRAGLRHCGCCKTTTAVVSLVRIRDRRPLEASIGVRSLCGGACQKVKCLLGVKIESNRGFPNHS
jgi:hypothetical protein